MARGPDVPLSINHSCTYCSTDGKKIEREQKSFLTHVPNIYTMKNLGLEIKLHTFQSLAFRNEWLTSCPAYFTCLLHFEAVKQCIK